MKMVGALGQMKGAAMKLGQFASFIDTEFIPEEYREIYQEQLAKLRTDAPAMPWEKVVKVLEEEYDGEPLSEIFAEIEHEAFAAASIGQVHRAELLDGRESRSRSSTRGSPRRWRPTCATPARSSAWPGRSPPGLDAKAIAEELRERVMEELDYEYEAQNQRTFSRAYRDHPFIYVPEVVTRLSRRRVLVTELVEGMRLRGDQGAAARGAQPLRRDRLPRQLRLDLPPAALQRRPPPRQLHPDGRRPRRLPRLRHDQEARPRADPARAARLRRRLARRPGGLPRGPARPRLRQEALEARRRAADGAHAARSAAGTSRTARSKSPRGG